MDSALGDVLSAGWTDDPAPAPDQHQVATPEYPPLPMREAAKPRKKATQQATSISTDSTPSAPPTVARDTSIASTQEVEADDDQEPGENDDHATFDIGLLTDLATGRKTPQEAAQAAGVSLAVLEDALATTLRDSSADDIAKALAIQASEQQLKSGAIYGAILFDLVRDMQSGRLQPKEKIKFAELVAAVGKIMPKEDKGVTAGGGFVLNINLGQSEPKTIVLDKN